MRAGSWRALEIAGACDGDADARNLAYANGPTVEDAERWHAWLVANGEDR